jgi:hypothetical protein
MKINKDIEAYAVGYFYGRAEGSYGQTDFDYMSESETHSFKLGYDRGVSDFCDYDMDNLEIKL